MGKKEFFYIRVSTKGQNEARQLDEARKLGIDERDIYIDKQSGKDFDRPRYQILKEVMREGDLLYLSSLDRLGRTREVLKEWEDLTKTKGIDIKVLDMPLLDTTREKDLLGTFVSDLVLQVLTFVAENEREQSLKRQRGGINAAKAAGVHLGRPKVTLEKLNRGQMADLKKNYSLWESKQLKGTEFAKMLKLKKNSFYNIMKEYERSLEQ